MDPPDQADSVSTGTDGGTNDPANDDDSADETPNSDVAGDDGTTTGDITNGDGSDTGQNEPIDNEPSVDDQQIPSTVPVTFDITVPAYQSDELRVELSWGDINFLASWIGDEYWSATADLPTQTKHPLTVTFYDKNGDIALASYNGQLETGILSTESIKITAEQFDATLFDIDQDSFNNLSELIAGTDPLVDEDALLEIRDFYDFNKDSRISVSKIFEAALTEERPFFQSFDETIDSVTSITGGIDIDANGNGTYNRDFNGRIETLALTGTRTQANNSITWEGERRAYDGDYVHEIQFSNTVTIVDETTREYVENITGRNNGTFDYRWESNTQLIGELVEGSSQCKPVAGTGSITNSELNNQTTSETTFQKEIDDQYWRVEQVDSNGDVTEWFARELRMTRDDDPEDGLFVCDFVDLR